MTHARLSRLRIIVSGLAGMHPVGGMAWHYLQYVIGLARLGHDVYYHEDTWTWPYDPIRNTQTDSGEHSADFIGRFYRRFAPELSDRWHYRHLHEQSYGMSAEAFDEVARSADVLLNVSGANFLPDALQPGCTKVFIDTDPGYNQILMAERPEWAKHVDRWCDSVAAHDRHFTFAENINSDDCTVPRLGFDWRPTRMPVVLDLWDASPSPGDPSPWSTVMTWNVYRNPLIYRGVEYGGKGPEFEKLMSLPGRLQIPLRVAVGGTEAPRERLVRSGWQVVDGPQSTLTAEQYAGFIANSRGEISAAKQVYVAMRTGWFSERTACYLACGRPAVVQDTGFARHLPVGSGLMAFTTPEEAADAIESVEADYGSHALAARATAASCFEAGAVLTRLLQAL